VRRILPAAISLALVAGLVLWVARPPSESTLNVATESATGDPRAWQRAVGILQYLQTDYPAAVQSGSPTELKEQLSFAEEVLHIAQDQLGPKGQAFLPRLSSLRARVGAAQDPDGVSRECGLLVEELVLAGGLPRAPRHAPDLTHGQTLFGAACAGCHGVDGRAQVPLADTLKPRPANLQSGIMDGLSPYKVFNVLTLGVQGTSMPTFAALPDQDRWDLAFYAFTLRQPACQGQAAPAPLETVANATDAELTRRYGAKALACLRWNVPKASQAVVLEFAREGLEEAGRMEANGDGAGARQALVDAYLNGIEPVEPLLRSRDPELVTRIEDAFLRARLDAERKSPRFPHEVKGLLLLVDQARSSGTSIPRAWSVFWLALLVMMREGFEAMVVITALLAVLKKMGQEHQQRVVNVAWVLALVAGAVVFIFGREVFAGADRELLEGATALFASGMLIYAALWLNARSNMRKFMGELREKMQGALGRGSTLGLFTIAFMSVFRESLETAIFLEGLAVDSARGAIWGGAAGLVVMVLFAVMVNRVGYVLPMKAMFNASTALLYATAVVLVGKGVHALQEVGLIPLHPIRMFTVDLLGLYPDAFSFFPQLALVLLPWLWHTLSLPAGGGREARAS
jgi:high-affinity iron transporter